MKNISKNLLKLLLFPFMAIQALHGQNQTPDITPVLPPDSLPFSVRVELADFSLPIGVQSFATGIYKDLWLLMTGRTGGLHGFNNNDFNFPISEQNSTVFVIDSINGVVYTKSLYDPSSLLTQAQIDILSSTNVEFVQVNNTLYLIGGYGYDTAAGQFHTNSTLSAIDLPGMINWVMQDIPGKSAAQNIRQTSHPLLQVTGGRARQADPHSPVLLMFGQNFSTFYTPSTTGVYTEQVRSFQIIDNGKQLYVYPNKQPLPLPDYRRRDLNILPIMQKTATSYVPGFVALSGVFTPGNDPGVWTVPIVINANGTSFEPNPADPNTFKQGMNNYHSAFLSLYSKNENASYLMLFGGMSYITVNNGVFIPDAEIPFVNTITTVKLDSTGNFAQYLMDAEFPLILSTTVNPGNPLLFGAVATFIPLKNIPAFYNDVFDLDQLGPEPILLGYIVGGIQSTLPNTNTQLDSAPSPYIFRVILEPR